jgi:hypothetical protein
METNTNLNLEKERVLRCYNLNLWILGFLSCSGCEERFNVIGEQVPCKQPSPQEQNTSHTA